MAEGTEPAEAEVEEVAEATDGEYSGDITLAASGATDIEVKVTAEDGVAEAKYMITVSKEAADHRSQRRYIEKAERDGG